HTACTCTTTNQAARAHTSAKLAFHTSAGTRVSAASTAGSDPLDGPVSTAPRCRQAPTTSVPPATSSTQTCQSSARSHHNAPSPASRASVTTAVSSDRTRTSATSVISRATVSTGAAQPRSTAATSAAPTTAGAG